jgi:hypothetical protein
LVPPPSQVFPAWRALRVIMTVEQAMHAWRRDNLLGFIGGFFEGNFGGEWFGNNWIRGRI